MESTNSNKFSSIIMLIKRWHLFKIKIEESISLGKFSACIGYNDDHLRVLERKHEMRNRVGTGGGGGGELVCMQPAWASN